MPFESDVKAGPSLFQLASKRMEWLAERQKLVATNIANADTPDYRARDLGSFEDFLSTGDLRAREVSASWDQSLDGNRVVLEEQMLQANEIEGSHRLASRLYRKGHDMIGLAVSK